MRCIYTPGHGLSSNKRAIHTQEELTWQCMSMLLTQTDRPSAMPARSESCSPGTAASVQSCPVTEAMARERLTAEAVVGKGAGG